MFLSDNVKEIKMIQQEVEEPIIPLEKETTVESIKSIVDGYNSLPFYMKIFKVFSIIKLISTLINNK